MDPWHKATLQQRENTCVFSQAAFELRLRASLKPQAQLRDSNPFVTLWWSILSRLLNQPMRRTDPVIAGRLLAKLKIGVESA